MGKVILPWVRAGRISGTIGIYLLSIGLLAACHAASNQLTAWPQPEFQPASHAMGSAYPGECQPWVQVNTPAFGLPSNANAGESPAVPAAPDPYQSEEGFERVVFQDRLYLGMEADNALGARLWRTKAGQLLARSQADWEEVVADKNGNPFSNPDRVQNDHIDSLAVFNGHLYASTANRSDNPTGFRLYRSQTGNSGDWLDLTRQTGPGFGDSANENFKDMQVYGNELCGGTWNEVTGAQIWCSPDGQSWRQVNRSGFGDPKTAVVWSAAVFNDGLYVGVQNFGKDLENTRDDVARIYRTTDLDTKNHWQPVYEGRGGSHHATLIGAFKGDLYFSSLDRLGLLIFRSPSGVAGSWAQANRPGMAAAARPARPENYVSVIDGAVVYNDTLYLAVSNSLRGWQLWRTSGSVIDGQGRLDWENAMPRQQSDPQQVYSVLVSFRGYLYAWVTNYHTGQQVWRTRCPVCQQKLIPAVGVYHFDPAGVTLNFSAENLDRVEVCISPHAAGDDMLPGGQPVGLVEIAVWPPAASYHAAIAIQPGSEARLEAGSAAWYLAHRSAAGGYDCRVEDRTGLAEDGTITCSEAADLAGTWSLQTGAAALTLPAGGENSMDLGVLLGLIVIVLLKLFTLAGRMRTEKSA